MAPQKSYIVPVVALREDEYERRTLEGVSWSEVVHLAHELKLSLSEVARVVGIPSSSFFSRKGKRFSMWSSERILRYDRLLKLGEKVFGGGAVSWLVAPNPYLGGATPLAKARTEAGARQVELLMARIDHGLG
ncbi:MAG: DUF2384 domain-containing protein [Opitutaceae bacterium]|nr:DUF2384 domain-containing protein [Cephaloticoccus sp.]MCP5530217.1 DUF2384 domain-containing protein [Opitutaceae bacterium]